MEKLPSGAWKRLLCIGLYIAAPIVVLGVLHQSFYVLLAVLVLITIAARIFLHWELLESRANLNYVKGDREKARPVLHKCIDRNTQNPIVYLNYANLLMREENGQEALSLLHKAQTLNPPMWVDKNIRLSIGTCHWVLGALDEAIATLEQMRADYEYINETALTTLGYMYLLNKDYEKAHECTDKAIEDTPEYASAWDNKGQIFYAQNDFAQAEESFTKALAYNPTLVDSLYFMGVLRETAGDCEAAADYFRRAAEAPISALNTVTKAQILEKMEDMI